MYIPDIFKEEDVSKIYDFIREFSFATIISSGSGKPVATHTPLVLRFKDDKPVLAGHIAAANPQKEWLVNGAETLCIFQGPNAYVSPRWYTEMDVPTWNYRSVHVYGTVSVLEGAAVMELMKAMVDRYESTKEQPVKMEEMPAAMLEAQLKHIHVFEIAVTELQAAEKMSQNRDDASYKNIVNELKQDGDFNAMLLAFEMERRKKRK